MAKQINFEVQVMQGGRWTISARFPSTGQELAVEEAKQIDASGIGEVRVLRDVYDSETGMSTEFTVYKSSGSGGGDGDNYSRSGGGGGGGGDWDDDDDDDGGSDDDWMQGGDDDDDYDDDDDDDDDDGPVRKSSKKKGKGDKQTGFTGLLVKLLFAILLALGLSATVVAVMSPYIEGVNFFGMRLTGVAKENALIMTFLVTFLASSIMLAVVLLQNTSLKARKKKAQARRPAARRPAARPAGGQATQQASQQAAAPAKDDTTKLAPMDETGSMEQFREEAADGSPPAAPEGEKKEGDDPAKRAIILDAEDMPMIGENGELGMSPHAEKQKKYMMGFIDKAMTAVGKDKKSMSNFDKFGVSLFLAGACESLGQNQDIDGEALAKIMADSVQTMGFKRSHAKTFADKYEEYLVQDATYMQMFQAGRNAMATYSTDESRITQNTSAAMTEWNKPKVKEAEAGPVTVLFTDIAGSTAMTQNLGDAGAQQVVRAHNRVVREALTMWNGKEVKHTGDGIMASFVKTSDSLDAAMQMQRESAEYTAQNPDKPLHLKIGINAGEPISEDNDLFGSTVQMSARIVDKAQADEIFVSEIVRGICAGKSYKFTSRGTYPMKGFETDPVLYEVVWKEE